MKRGWVLLLSLIAVVGFSGTASATLWDRGGGLIYDDHLNITWLQNANLGAGSTYDNGSNTTDGYMYWANAAAWANQLVYGGYDDWRLPSAYNQDGSGPDTGYVSDSEMGYMYYVNLGGSAGGPGPSSSFTDGNGHTLSFQNLQLKYFWLEEEASGSTAWDYFMDVGHQGFHLSDEQLGAWAVRPGDGSPVPEPATMLLLGSGLVGLAGCRRKFRKR